MAFKKKSFDLSGKVAVVIGGTRGIGRGISLTLADHGADVIPTSRNAANCEAVAQEISELGRKSLVCAGDSSQEPFLTELRDKVLSAFGRVDIWSIPRALSIAA